MVLTYLLVDLQSVRPRPAHHHYCFKKKEMITNSENNSLNHDHVIYFFIYDCGWIVLSLNCVQFGSSSILFLLHLSTWFENPFF